MTFEQIIERFAELAKQEIEEMADAAYVALGFTPQFVRRSRGQKRRWKRMTNGR